MSEGDASGEGGSSTPSSDSAAWETGLTATSGQELGWIVDLEDVNPYTNQSQTSSPYTNRPSSGSNYFGGNSVEPNSGAIARDCSNNPYTGSQSIDPYTGQQHVYSSGALANDVHGGAPGVRYVPREIMPLPGETRTDIVSIDGRKFVHYRIVLGGTSYDAYLSDASAMGLLVPISPALATATALPEPLAPSSYGVGSVSQLSGAGLSAAVFSAVDSLSSTLSKAATPNPFPATASVQSSPLSQATTLNLSPTTGSVPSSPMALVFRLAALSPPPSVNETNFQAARDWWKVPFGLIYSAVGFGLSAFSGGENPAHAPMSSSADRPRESSKSAQDRIVNVAPLFVGAGGSGFVAASLRGAGVSGAWATVGIGASGGAAEGLSEVGFQDLRRGQVSDASEYASKTFGGFLGGGVAAGLGYGAFVGLPGVIGRHESNWSFFNEAFSKDVAERVTFDPTLPMRRRDWRKVVLLNERFQMSNADELMQAQGYIPLQSHFRNNTGIDRVYTNFSRTEVITVEFKNITGFQPDAIMKALASRKEGWGELQGSSEYNVVQAMRYLNSEAATPEMRETGRLILDTPQHARELWISDEYGRVRSFDLSFWEMLDPRW